MSASKLLVCQMIFLMSCFAAKISYADQRPNILFCFADDWGRYASIYQNPSQPGMCDVINTPTLDEIGRSGVVFQNAFVSAPSCTPCRASVSTGMPFYRCGTNAFLRCREFGGADDPYRSLTGFSELLVQNGYHVMHWGKTTNKAGKKVDRTHGNPIHYFSQAVTAAEDKEACKQRIYSLVQSNFKKFLDRQPSDQPFFYWFGPHHSHRQWVRGSGKELWGIDPDSLKGKVPAFLPDVHDVREDLADYLGEAQAWDGMIHSLVQELKTREKLNNTIIIVSGDHGMPGMPRGKCNLHDFGSSVSLLVSWPERVIAKRKIDDFVSLMDIAPTILEAAGIERPKNMLAKSFLDLLVSSKHGWVDSTRDHVIIGRERHVGEARQDRTPYPSRAIRTKDFLFIRNFKPERNPMGDIFQHDSAAEDLLQNHYLAYPDMDASPTKVFLMENREHFSDYHEYAFGKRPAYELYDLEKDPDQIVNVASHPDYTMVRDELLERMMKELRETGDPRVIGDGATFDQKPYVDPEYVPPPKKKKDISF